MSIDNNLPRSVVSAIGALVNARTEWVASREEDKALNLNAAFYDLCEEYWDHPSERVAEVIVKYMPDIFNACSMHFNYTLEDNTHDVIVTLLSQDRHLSNFLGSPDANRWLSWYCCTHAVRYQYQNVDEYTNAFRDVLSKWTGRPFADVIEPTLDYVVTHIYGTAFWALHGPDDLGRLTTYDFCKLVNTISKTVLPIVKTRSQNVGLNVELPDNMIK